MKGVDDNLVLADVDAVGVATITLNRPEKRNAVTMAMFESLDHILLDLIEREGLRVVVVRGSGPSLCAGADLSEWADPGAWQASHMSSLGAAALRRLAEFPCITIARIHGAALGGGLELALACDLRIAAEDAQIGLPEVRLGNLPGWGGMARLVERVGPSAARHLLLTGSPVSGEQAFRLGLVHAVAPAEHLDTVLHALVGEVMAGDPRAQSLAKAVLASYESTISVESMLAGFTAEWPSSRQRKEQFLRKRR
jgi:enoyl-CoA hydratase/carnithine racemase